ncbi:CU044_5270 family protein [Micromonospora coerulea]
MFGEERTRTLLGPADPARNTPVAPPRFSAYDLMARAGATAAPVLPRRPARPTRRLVLAAGAVAAAAGVATVVHPFAPTAPGGSTTAGPSNAEPGMVLVPVAYQFDAGALPAGAPLRALAGRLAATGYDTRAGRYLYHHTKTWGDPVMTSDDGRHTVAFADETKVWQPLDGTGRQVTVQLEPQYPDQASRDYWRGKLTSGPQGAPGAMPLPPMELAPLPSGQAGLRELLKVRFGAGAASKEVSTVYGRYAVPRRTRAEILRVLADVPGFRWRGEVTDRAGRKGLAITFDDRSHNAQSLLIFDPRTGELLAHERLTLSPVRISAYQVILETDRTDRLG